MSCFCDDFDVCRGHGKPPEALPAPAKTTYDADTRTRGQRWADADKDVSEGLERVGAPGPWVLRRLGRWARRLARLDVVRKSGRLRRSLTVLVGKRGA
jgi:hypothetical protein